MEHSFLGFWFVDAWKYRVWFVDMWALAEKDENNGMAESNTGREPDKIVQIADPDGYYDYKSVLIGAKAGYQAAMGKRVRKYLNWASIFSPASSGKPSVPG